MKKTKLDKSSILKMLAHLFIGFGIGLIAYQYLTDWMPLASGVFILTGIVFIILSKK